MNKKRTCVLILGGAGYIGSHIFFSTSCAVNGIPGAIPITEEQPKFTGLDAIIRTE